MYLTMEGMWLKSSPTSECHLWHSLFPKQQTTSSPISSNCYLLVQTYPVPSLCKHRPGSVKVQKHRGNSYPTHAWHPNQCSSHLSQCFTPKHYYLLEQHKQDKVARGARVMHDTVR